MRRVVAAVLVCVVPAVAAGCTVGEANAPAPSVVRAPPQSAKLRWSEPYPEAEPALVFGVSSFTVTRTGWQAEISVENTGTVAWKLHDERLVAGRAFGVMLFPNDDLDELERRSRGNALPAIRQATTFEPALPRSLAPGKTWHGTISAPGALAGGLWVRVSFGPFVSDGDPPPGADPAVVWITDHAYHLDEVKAVPA
jgi:hypothetical protein